MAGTALRWLCQLCAMFLLSLPRVSVHYGRVGQYAATSRTRGKFASILRPLGPSSPAPGSRQPFRQPESKTKLKINHLRSSPEPPELAGFYVDTAIAAAPDTPGVAYIIIGHQHEDPQRAAPHTPRTGL